MTLGQRAKKAIAHAALTNSKRPEVFPSNYPTHITKARGCYVWDENGKRLIDFVCALGTNFLGYAHKEINDAVKAQMDKGSLYSLGSDLEVEFAEKIQETFSYCERVRVLKSGTEGCNAAIRIARAATGREWVISDGYHGWSDDFVSLTPPAKGIPMPRPWIGTLRELRIPSVPTLTAAIIVEPVITDFSDKRVQELLELREFCTRNKICLIFDETISAIRFPGLSVANHTGIYPDISVFGKALANGLPISVVAGRAKFMDADYFVSSSFAGDTLSMRAAMEVLRIAKHDIDGIWEYANRFVKNFNLLAPDLVHIEGYPTRGVFKAKDDETKAIFFQEACKAGLLFGPSFFWCEPHNMETSLVLGLCNTIFTRMRNGETKLDGELPVTPFAQKQRENK